jgi:hypothetical protein
MLRSRHTSWRKNRNLFTCLRISIAAPDTGLELTHTDLSLSYSFDCVVHTITCMTQHLVITLGHELSSRAAQRDLETRPREISTPARPYFYHMRRLYPQATSERGGYALHLTAYL